MHLSTLPTPHLCSFCMNFLFYILHNKFLFFSSISNGFPLLQVMYDATGVRLHAGRQAEVIFLSTFFISFSSCFDTCN